MTPPELALRQRLERVLGADRDGGRSVPEPQYDYTKERERRTSNEVRDESGGWPWREREQEPDSLSTPTSSSSSLFNPQPAVTSLPLSPSTPSLTASSTQTQFNLTRARSTSKPRSPRSPPHHIPPVPPLPLHLSAPRTPRSTTLPAEPVTPRHPPTPRHAYSLEANSNGRDDAQRGRMPTPPPTPPSGRPKSRLPSHTRTAAGEKGSSRDDGQGSPTPYRVRKTEPVGMGLVGGTPVSPSRLVYPNPNSASQSSRVGLVRRGSTRTSEVVKRRSLSRSRSRSPSPSTSSNSHSQSNSHTSCNTSSEDAIPPLSLSIPSHPSSAPSTLPHYPTTANPTLKFNARRASDRLRATSGYVSFASVEGLGGPPETPIAEDGDEGLGEEERRGRKGRRGTTGGIGGRLVGWVWGAVGA
ncbi:hypothetical protein C0991_007050 [Blastosporella zonata]|nr:hypothetical protein C0991_007050 [Blastosporella zonata]